jgi:hypothetical protein
MEVPSLGQTIQMVSKRKKLVQPKKWKLFVLFVLRAMLVPLFISPGVPRTLFK